MPTALIISLNFNPGHVSHLVASYRQCEELGYESVYCIDATFKSFIPPRDRFVLYGEKPCPRAEIAFFLFPSFKNLPFVLKLKRQGTKILYIFHEPLAPIKEYKKAGFSSLYLAKLWLINRVSSLTVKWSDVVLLPSQKAVSYYLKNPLYKNDHFHYLPLLYDDERTFDLERKSRQYFSYIGTIASDHSFTEYLRFVKWAIVEDRLPDVSFLIATKSEFEVPEELEESQRVVIQKGRAMTDLEINNCYASSYVVWNAYSRTTQSGVLAKSFMFGTPAIVLRQNLSEFTENGKEVMAIDDNTSVKEIEFAIKLILQDFDSFSDRARNRFVNSYYYRNYNEKVKSILNSIQ